MTIKAKLTVSADLLDKCIANFDKIAKDALVDMDDNKHITARWPSSMLTDEQKQRFTKAFADSVSQSFDINKWRSMDSEDSLLRKRIRELEAELAALKAEYGLTDE